MNFPLCVSCGMPMRAPADFAAGDTAKNFCVHCGDANGNLKTYEEVLAGFTGFISTTQGLVPQAAQSMAAQAMSSMPAWANR